MVKSEGCVLFTHASPGDKGLRQDRISIRSNPSGVILPSAFFHRTSSEAPSGSLLETARSAGFGLRILSVKVILWVFDTEGFHNSEHPFAYMSFENRRANIEEGVRKLIEFICKLK